MVSVSMSNELTAEKVKDSNTDRVNSNKIRLRLTRALFGCISVHKSKLPEEGQEAFENDLL